MDGFLQDTSDPKKVVLDMRSEHFVEALPLWHCRDHENDVRPTGSYWGRNSVTTLKIPKDI